MDKDNEHYPRLYLIESVVDLVELILQPRQSDINSDPEEIGFSTL